MSNTSAELTLEEANLFAGFQISQLLLMAVFALILPLDFVGYIEFLIRVYHGQDRNLFYLRTSLILSGASGVIAVALVTVVAFATDMDKATCDAYQRSMVGLYYVCILFSFSFLLEKAQLVGKFASDSRTYQRVFRVTQLGILCVVPAVLGVGVGLSEGRLSVPTGRCMQSVPTAMLWFFDFAQVVMSLALLYLFVHPIRANIKMAGPERATMRAIYVKNAVISCMAVCFTFSIVTTYIVLHQVAVIDPQKEVLYYTAALLLVPYDVLALVLATRLTTNLWLPICLRKHACIAHSSSGSSAPDAMVSSKHAMEKMNHHHNNNNSSQRTSQQYNNNNNNLRVSLNKNAAAPLPAIAAAATSNSIIFDFEASAKGGAPSPVRSAGGDGGGGGGLQGE